MDLTLSKNFILRKKPDRSCILYDKSTNMRYTITEKLFAFLYIFKENTINLNALLSYFETKNISTDDIKTFLSRSEMWKLLIPTSSYQYKIIKSQPNNIYNSLPLITPYTEFTPERVDFLITKKCNLKCRHCFENASPLENIVQLDKDILKRVFYQMEYLNVKTLKITGGEPFCHPQIHSVLELISNARFETIILTNGMLLTEDSINLIRSSNIKLGISLDGITSKTHDFIRGKGSFDILYDKLIHIGQIGIDLTLTFTANKVNESELEQLASVMFNEIGVRCIFVNRLRPIGRANESKDIFISDDKYIIFQERVSNLAAKYGKEKILLSDDSIQFEESDNKKHSDAAPLICAAGNSLICMDEYLNIYPCIYGQGNRDYIIGNLTNESLLDIWQSEKWNLFRGNTTLSQIKGCSTCNKRSVCGIKNCRLKPVYNGLGFYDHVSYCNYE